MGNADADGGGRLGGGGGTAARNLFRNVLKKASENPLVILKGFLGREQNEFLPA